MFKLIACDLDETLLNDNKEICQRNIEAIQKAQREYGVKFVPATGRGYTCIDHVLYALDVYDKENEYTISNNGGVLSENKGYRELAFHELAFEKASEILTFGLQKDVCIQVFTAKDVYSFHTNEDEKRWLFNFKPDAILCEVNHIDFLKDERITKILFQSLHMPYLQALDKEMRPITNSFANTSFSSNRYLEINHAGIDKGVGLHELANHLGIDMKDTMAIGDNFNDMAMLEEAGLSIAVANAIDEIKEISDYVTLADNNEGAVGEAIAKFIFQS